MIVRKREIHMWQIVNSRRHCFWGDVASCLLNWSIRIGYFLYCQWCLSLLIDLKLTKWFILLLFLFFGHFQVSVSLRRSTCSTPGNRTPTTTATAWSMRDSLAVARVFSTSALANSAPPWPSPGPISFTVIPLSSRPSKDWILIPTSTNSTSTSSP